MICALAGGVGAARMLRGLAARLDPADLVAVCNTGDDAELHGLHVSPDIDTVTYTLAGRADDERGWGLRGETWTVMDALDGLGGETWFRLGDRDLATHLFRTGRLRAGASLSEVTAAVAAALGVRVRLLPMSDDPVRTRLTLADGEHVDFQEYFVHRHHSVPVRDVNFEGAADAEPAPGVLDALTSAEGVVLCPSNPILSIAPILAVPGVAAALAARRASVVAVSPIVAGAALKGPADRLLVELGGEASVAEVARRYAGVAGTLVVDEADRQHADAVEAAGLRCVVAPTVMSTPQRASLLADTVLDAIGQTRAHA